MHDASANTMKWIVHLNEMDLIQFQSASILVCSVNGPLIWI